MRTELYKITTGSLLHDVGKVVHRTGDSHSHAESGYAFLKEQTGLDDAEILQQVRFHHAAELKKCRSGAEFAGVHHLYCRQYRFGNGSTNVGCAGIWFLA